MTNPSLTALVFVSTMLSLGGAACGGVRHATRPGGGAEAPEAKDPTLVEVRTTGFEGAARTVSFSTWDVDPADALPPTAPADVVEEMRAEAARNGADMLLLERIEDAWRKLWLGLGVKKDDAATREVVACAQPGFAAALEDAKARAVRCVQGVLYERAGLRGEVTAVFEVDPSGAALRAAPTPDSSRDSQFQQCVVGAVHGTAFGEPSGFTCQGRVTVQIVGPGSVQ